MASESKGKKLASPAPIPPILRTESAARRGESAEVGSADEAAAPQTNRESQIAVAAYFKAERRASPRDTNSRIGSLLSRKSMLTRPIAQALPSRRDTSRQKAHSVSASQARKLFRRVEKLNERLLKLEDTGRRTPRMH